MIQRRNRTLLFAGALAASGILIAVALLTGPTRGAGAAQQPEEKSAPAARGDEQGIRQAGRAYVEALNKGDLDAVMAFWAPDADYIDESGKITKGRDAIAALFKKSLSEMKGAKYSAKMNSLKFLRPEVALEDGTLESVAVDGTKETDRYAVVWVKSGDKWLLSSARDLPTEVTEVPSLAYPQLKQLEWLVGDWQDASDKVDVQVTCKWAPNKSFLLMNYTVKREGEEPMDVTQRVGWDPLNGMVRSWVFDSNGGFGEGYWQRQGNKWVVGCSGVLPDGGAGGATNIYEFVDQNTFVWRSTDRDVDGQPVADAEVKFVRKAAK
jgi:uncharacterized protein (TIGR02246 family)